MTLLNSIPGLTASTAGPMGGGFWMPEQASTIAHEVDWIFFLIYWICVFFFVLIMALTVLFIVKYRRRPGDRPEGGPTHNTPLELTWTIIPLILVILIFYVGLEGYVDLIEAPKNSYEVNVIAQKWSWTFEHRNGAVEIDRLTVPEGRPVKLIMSSEDVLHAMFIPAFRVKQDAVPGRYTTLWFEATKRGAYQAFCAEYCGTEHSQMTAVIDVLPPDEFEEVIYQKSIWIQDVPDDRLYIDAGPRLFARCASCHSVDGSTKTGPSFRETHELWGKSRTLKDGSTVTVDENYIKSSLMNPGGQIVMNFPNQMPALGLQLKEKEIRALVEFIQRLDEVYDEQGNLIAE